MNSSSPPRKPYEGTEALKREMQRMHDNAEATDPAIQAGREKIRRMLSCVPEPKERGRKMRPRRRRPKDRH